MSVTSRWTICLLAVLPTACAKPATSIAPRTGPDWIAVVSDPPGVTVMIPNDQVVGTTPTSIHREAAQWSRVRTELTLQARPQDRSQCSQVRFIPFDQPTPDTVRFDMHRCPPADQDFSRIFELDEVQIPPQVTAWKVVEAPPLHQLRDTVGFVLAEFVVDSTGHVDPKSYRLLVITDSVVLNTAREMVLSWTYRPARVLGHRVRVRVHAPMTFHMQL